VSSIFLCHRKQSLLQTRGKYNSTLNAGKSKVCQEVTNGTAIVVVNIVVISTCNIILSIHCRSITDSTRSKRWPLASQCQPWFALLVCTLSIQSSPMKATCRLQLINAGQCPQSHRPGPSPGGNEHRQAGCIAKWQAVRPTGRNAAAEGCFGASLLTQPMGHSPQANPGRTAVWRFT
jgi:hypothetical protein